MLRKLFVCVSVSILCGLALQEAIAVNNMCCTGDGSYDDCNGCQQIFDDLWANMGDNDYDKCIDGPSEAGFQCDDDVGICWHIEPVFDGYATKAGCQAGGVPDWRIQNDHGKNVNKCNSEGAGDDDDSCD